MTTATKPATKKCGARKRDGSQQDCGMAAGYGTDHPGIGRCKFHGGCTPTHRARALREMDEQQPAGAIPADAVPAGGELDIRVVTGPTLVVGPEGALLLLSVMDIAESEWRHAGEAPPAGWHEIYETLSEVAAAGP